MSSENKTINNANTEVHYMIDQVMTQINTWEVQGINPITLIIRDSQEYKLIAHFRELRRVSIESLSDKLIQNINEQTERIKSMYI